MDALIGAGVVVGLIILARKAIRAAGGDPSPEENDRPPIRGPSRPA
jgi:hypothetical protein